MAVLQGHTSEVQRILPIVLCPRGTNLPGERDFLLFSSSRDGSCRSWHLQVDGTGTRNGTWQCHEVASMGVPVTDICGIGLCLSLSCIWH